MFCWTPKGWSISRGQERVKKALSEMGIGGFIEREMATWPQKTITSVASTLELSWPVHHIADAVANGRQK